MTDSGDTRRTRQDPKRTSQPKRRMRKKYRQQMGEAEEEKKMKEKGVDCVIYQFDFEEYCTKKIFSDVGLWITVER